MLFPVWRELGRIGEFESATRKAVEEAPGVVAYRTGLAFLLCEIGRLGEAAEILEAVAKEGFAPIAADFTQNFNLCEMAEVAVAVGDTARAKELADVLRPRAGMASHIHPLAYHGAVDRYVGLLELSLGDPDQAVHDFEEALAIHERMEARPWSARTRYDLARALLARNRHGDRDQAVRLLNEAISTANDLGMKRLLEEALAAKLEFQGIVSSSPQASIDVVAAGVSVERPDLSLHADVDGRVTIAFSDIEGYTAAVERLGDTRSQALLRAHDQIVRDAVAAHRGRVVKSQGDGFMMAFASPSNALSCAIAIQQSIAGHDFDGESVRLRIGVHAGSVISEGDDFFGRTVILAARVAASAAGGEILITSDIRDAAPDVSYGAARVVALKGLTGTHQVYPVVWRSPDA
jgi:class 3 adenylate cyclase/thioredoxin-like negative regulator of GroEL